VSRADTRSISTEVLRQALAQAIEAASFRAISRESGVSPIGLHRLLAGAEPQQRTRRKLEGWYVQRVTSLHSDVTPALAATALQLLASGLPPSKRRDAIRRVVGAWVAEYKSANVTLPAWLESVRKDP